MEENTSTWIFLAYRLEFPREDGGTEEKSPHSASDGTSHLINGRSPCPSHPRHLVAETSGAKKTTFGSFGHTFKMSNATKQMCLIHSSS